MSSFPPRQPSPRQPGSSSDGRLNRAARQPLVSALLGGLVVLAAGAIAVAAGWIGNEKTIVQSPIAQPAVSDAGKGPTVADIYKRYGDSVVFIRSEVQQRAQSQFGFPQEQQGQATGSGFVLDKEGHVLTNEHVVDGATAIEVGLSETDTAKAKVIGVDASNDLALLKVDVDADKLEPLPLGDSSKLSVGDPVVAIGNPFGLDRTVTTGIVSAKQRELQAPNGFTIKNVIQTDAAINPGNSGGPLLDGRGRVIGINSQIATAGGRGSVGIGFAVPVDTAKEIVAQLKDKGKVDHAYLGITGVTIADRLSESLNLPADQGVLVQTVTDPAKKAGIRGGDTQASVAGADIRLGGDVIVEVEGRRIASMQQVVNVVDSKKPGDEIEVVVLRGSDRKTITVQLEKRPQNTAALQREQSEQQDQQPQVPDLIP